MGKESESNIKMDYFDKQFITELFLESDSVTSLNRLVVAIANVVNENNENMNVYNEALKDEFHEVLGAADCELDTSLFSQKTHGYYEHVVQNFNEDDYLAKFQMRKSTVQALINFLKEHVKSQSSIVPMDKKVHMFLWLITSDLSYNEVGNLFGIHKSSVCYLFHEVATIIADQRYHFISWPSIEEQHITRIKVNSRFKFPNCVGFIDACRFKLGLRQSKKDKLEECSVLLQAVCDESFMFTDVYVGEIGNTKKNKVYKDSSLSRELKNFVDFENHILGDVEYKLRKNLMTPFSSEELLTSEEMKFNEVHWKAYSYIGHTFELLKERFKKLSHMEIVKPDAVTTLIIAACVLHNFILLHEGCAHIKEEVVMCDDGVTIDTSIVKTAHEKRQFLCNYVNYIDIDVGSIPTFNEL